MTIAEMRAALGASATGLTDAAVAQAYLVFLQGQPEAAEPVSLDQAKANLRVTSSDEDGLIAALIVAAREAAEKATGLILTSRQVVQSVDSFDRWIDLYAWPIQSIASVTYRDGGGVQQVLAPSTYAAALNRRPVRLAPASLASWPSTAGQPGGIIVTVQAGYPTPDDVPATIKQSILLMIGHWFKNRSSVSAGIGAAAVEVPQSASWLLAMHKAWTV